MEDAFGTALWEYYQGKSGAEYTTERDDGHTDSADVAHYFYPYEDWEELTKAAAGYVRDGDRVLDIGCGAGRQTLWLQSEGHEAVGIDRSPLAIKVCHERGVERAAVMRMQNLAIPDSTFDTVLVVGNILGLGGSVADVVETLREFDRITTDEGRVIADSQDPFVEGEIEDDYFRNNRLGDREATRVRFRVRYDDLVEDWLEIALLGEEEFGRVVDDTHWTIGDVVRAAPGEGWYSLRAQWYFAVLDKA